MGRQWQETKIPPAPFCQGGVRKGGVVGSIFILCLGGNTFLCGIGLVHHRFVLNYIPAFRMNDEVAVVIDGNVVGGLYVEPVLFVIRAGLDNEIVFQFPLIAIIHEVDALIDSLPGTAPCRSWRRSCATVRDRCR